MEPPSKRSRSSSSVPATDPKRTRFTLGDPDRNSKRRIETQVLRNKKRQFLAARDAIGKSKHASVRPRTQSSHSQAKLRDDEGRIYRKKGLEMGAQCRQKLRLKGTESKKTKDLSPSRAISKQTNSREVWQTKVNVLSKELEAKIESVEVYQVQVALNDIVTCVEMATLKNDQERTQELLQWTTWIQEDTATCLEEHSRRIQSLEVFEAMEKQLIDDRVIELETQLAQKRAVEREKEAELASVRADQVEIVRLNQIVAQERLESLVLENTRLTEELHCVKEQVNSQSIEIDTMKNENAMWNQENEKLREESQELCEKLEKSEDQLKHQSAMREEMKALRGQLEGIESRETKVAAVWKTAKKEIEKHKQKKEELKILYAKFSSAMDAVSEKTMQLEELQQALIDAQSNISRLQSQRGELQKEIARLREEKAAHYRETKDLREELVIVRRQCAENQELESQHSLLTSKLKAEIAGFLAQNEDLHLKEQRQSVGQPSNEKDDESSSSDSVLVAQVAEKEALQVFIQRYYQSAEEKISRLLATVRVLESQRAKEYEKVGSPALKSYIS